jgi:hypothetical protein
MRPGAAGLRPVQKLLQGDVLGYVGRERVGRDSRAERVDHGPGLLPQLMRLSTLQPLVGAVMAAERHHDVHGLVERHEDIAIRGADHMKRG